MKNFLPLIVLCMVFLLPVITFSQEPASCEFNYASYTEHTPMPVTTFSPAIGLIGGKVYLTGGWDWTDYENNHAWDYLQVYDPETDSWDTTGARLPVPRAIYGGGNMALEGKLYVIGGLDWVNLGGGDWQMVPSARVDVYDPQSDTWELKANLPVPLGGKAACSLNGKIYVSGGTSSDQVPINSLFCYDPSTDQWSELSSMETPRLFHMSVALDDKIYVISGSDKPDPNSSTNKCEVYDPVPDQWTSIAPLPRTCVLGAACAVDGEIYVFGGGFSGPGNPLKSAYKYNPITDTWTGIDDMDIPAKEHSVIPVERTIFVFGASNSNVAFTHSYQVKVTANIINELCDIPASLQLYPNPSMGMSTLAYLVRTPGMIRIDICDILGKNVAVLLNEYRAPGEYEAQLNTGAFKPGIYFCRMHTTTGSATVKLMVEK